MSVVQYPTKSEALEMPKDDIVDILRENGITKFTRRYGIEKLVLALEVNDLLSHGGLTEAGMEPIEYTAEELENEKMTYFVRYVGIERSDVMHGVNSTPSHEKYHFPRGQYISVLEIDYRNKYERMVNKAIASGKEPAWQCYETSSLWGRIDKYTAKIKEIAFGRIPRLLIDLKFMDSHMAKQLEGYKIETIADLTHLTPEWISKTLMIDFPKAVDMKNDAIESIRRQSLKEGGKKDE